MNEYLLITIKMREHYNLTAKLNIKDE